MKRGATFTRFAKPMLLAFGAVCAFVTTAAAQIADFYARNGLKIVISGDVGSSFDATGRLLARHMPRHLPGVANIVSQNMPGAGGLTALNWLANIGPQDGTVIGVIIPQALFNQVFGDRNARFDPAAFHWIGNPLGSAVVTTVFHTAPIKTWQEARATSVIMGATGATGPDYMIPHLANATLGTKFTVLPGYKGGNDIALAMERGEVHGRGTQTWSGWKATYPAWVSEGKLVPLWQIGFAGVPELPQTPVLTDIIEGDDNKALVRAYTALSALGRPFVAPAGVPPERVAALRAAFDATMNDPAFIAEAEKLGLELSPLSGAKIQDIIGDLARLDPRLRDKLKSIIAP